MDKLFTTPGPLAGCNGAAPPAMAQTIKISSFPFIGELKPGPFTCVVNEFSQFDRNCTKQGGWKDGKPYGWCSCGKRVDESVTELCTRCQAPCWGGEFYKPPAPPMTLSHGGRALGGIEHPADQTCPLCDGKSNKLRQLWFLWKNL